MNDCNNIETSDIISDVSTDLDIYENQHISFEGFEVKEKIYTSTGRIEKSTSNSFRSTVNDEGSLQFQDLQQLEVCSRYEEEGEELKSPDQ